MDLKLEALLEGLRRKDRRALARAITLLESDASCDRPRAARILQTLKKSDRICLRLAISGPPGVGKSTFINALGQKLIERSLKVAILPIDPSSPESSGSILADKTRMQAIINEPSFFIRPSASRGVLGGVTIAMPDVIALVESFDFDVVIVETVGVGQSETSAYALTDYFLMLIQPGSGDALSALKKGIMERADYLLVNKADGELKLSAEGTFNMLKTTFKQQLPGVFLVSAVTNAGIDEFLGVLLSSFSERQQTCDVAQERTARFAQFFPKAFAEIIGAKLETVPWIKNRSEAIIAEVGKREGSFLAKLDLLGEAIVKRLES